MEKNELSNFSLLFSASIFLLGIGFGMMLSDLLELPFSILAFIPFILGSIVALIAVGIYGRKYDSFIKSLK